MLELFIFLSVLSSNCSLSQKTASQLTLSVHQVDEFVGFVILSMSQLSYSPDEMAM